MLGQMIKAEPNRETKYFRLERGSYGPNGHILKEINVAVNVIPPCQNSSTVNTNYKV